MIDLRDDVSREGKQMFLFVSPPKVPCAMMARLSFLAHMVAWRLFSTQTRVQRLTIWVCNCRLSSIKYIQLYFIRRILQHSPTMASWNDKQYNSQLSQCPVCLAKVANKKLQKHTLDCYENKKPQMESIGVIQCPFVGHHILPATFFNHHLDGNCQGVLNHLRKFYQQDELLSEFKQAPPDYDPGIPAKYLNQQNRNLLYMLDEHMYGKIRRDREDKANEAEQARAEEASRSAAPEEVD